MHLGEIDECVHIHTLMHAFFDYFSDVDDKLPDFAFVGAWYILFDKLHSTEHCIFPGKIEKST